jgi:hypothetical protein
MAGAFPLARSKNACRPVLCLPWRVRCHCLLKKPYHSSTKEVCLFVPSPSSLIPQSDVAWTKWPCHGTAACRVAEDVSGIQTLLVNLDLKDIHKLDSNLAHNCFGQLVCLEQIDVTLQRIEMSCVIGSRFSA